MLRLGKSGCTAAATKLFLLQFDRSKNETAFDLRSMI